MLRCEMNGKGPVLLLIHGIMTNRDYFAPIIPFLQDKYTIVMYDRRGYGENRDAAGEGCSCVTQADDAAELIKAAGGSAYILAHSIGAVIGIELIYRHPELIRGAFLVEPPFPGDAESRKIMDVYHSRLKRLNASGKRLRALFELSSEGSGRHRTPMAAGIEGHGAERRGVSDFRWLATVMDHVDSFMDHELDEICAYTPAIDRMPKKINVSVGISEEGRESAFAAAAKNTAESFHWPVVMLPGGHDTLTEYPERDAHTIMKQFNHTAM